MSQRSYQLSKYAAILHFMVAFFFYNSKYKRISILFLWAARSPNNIQIGNLHINVTTIKATNKVSLVVFWKSDVSNWTEDLFTSQESRLNNFISTILISHLLNASSLEKHVCVYVCICTVQMNALM